jgi:CheY-like chemotaxis protein
LVEDNAADEMLTVRALKEGNVPAEVHVARDAKQALSLLHGPGKLPNKPDLVLLDLNLPQRSGLDVLKIIRENKDTFDTPVVMLTSSIKKTDMQDSYKLRANGFILKATNPTQFLEEIKIAGLFWTTINLPRRENS